MASMTIRQLDDALMQSLRVRAARNNRSVEDEARDILCAALARDETSRQHVVESIRTRVAPFGGINLEIPTRDGMRMAPD